MIDTFNIRDIMAVKDVLILVLTKIKSVFLWLFLPSQNNYSHIKIFFAKIFLQKLGGILRSKELKLISVTRPTFLLEQYIPVRLDVSNLPSLSQETLSRTTIAKYWHTAPYMSNQDLMNFSPLQTTEQIQWWQGKYMVLL